MIQLQLGAVRGAACASVLWLATGCPFDRGEVWCGYEWSSQVSGATAYDRSGLSVPILASQTKHDDCFTMQEDYYLDEADPNNPAYVALRAQMTNATIANCELVGQQLVMVGFSHTDCSTAGVPPVEASVFTNDASCFVPFSGENWEMCWEYYDCQSGETGWDCDSDDSPDEL